MKTSTNKHHAKKSKQNTKNDLKSIPMAELLKKLDTTQNGLSQAEAKKRLIQYGPNELEEKTLILS